MFSFSVNGCRSTTTTTTTVTTITSRLGGERAFTLGERVRGQKEQPLLLLLIKSFPLIAVFVVMLLVLVVAKISPAVTVRKQKKKKFKSQSVRN